MSDSQEQESLLLELLDASPELAAKLVPILLRMVIQQRRELQERPVMVRRMLVDGNSGDFFN